jgi:hypothetical protein
VQRITREPAWQNSLFAKMQMFVHLQEMAKEINRPERSESNSVWKTETERKEEVPLDYLLHCSFKAFLAEFAES